VTRSPELASRLQGSGTTVFAEMSALALATGSINLGQGFPDYPGPPEVLDVARAAIGTAADQYPPGPGIPELREAVADHRRRFTGQGYDPDTEVLVTAGATEALAAAMLALLEPGDEQKDPVPLIPRALGTSLRTGPGVRCRCTPRRTASGGGRSTRPTCGRP
jgi:N-succinyldiaminopimelate aminotransferase